MCCVLRCCLQSALRDELAARSAQLEAAARSKMVRWEGEDSVHALQMSHEDARAARLGAQAEELAARAAAAATMATIESEASAKLSDLEVSVNELTAPH